MKYRAKSLTHRGWGCYYVNIQIRLLNWVAQWNGYGSLDCLHSLVYRTTQTKAILSCLVPKFAELNTKSSYYDCFYFWAWIYYNIYKKHTNLKYSVIRQSLVLRHFGNIFLASGKHLKIHSTLTKIYLNTWNIWGIISWKGQFIRADDAHFECEFVLWNNLCRTVFGLGTFW